MTTRYWGLTRRFPKTQNNSVNLTDPSGNNPLRAAVALWKIFRPAIPAVTRSKILPQVLRNAIIGGVSNTIAASIFHRFSKNCPGKEPPDTSNAFLAGAFAGIIQLGFDRLYPGGSRLRNFLMAMASSAIANGGGQVGANLATGKDWDNGAAENYLAGGLLGPFIKAIGGPSWVTIPMAEMLGGFVGDLTSEVMVTKGVCP